MGTFLRKSTQDCSIESDMNSNTLYKYCKNPDLYGLYTYGFRQEYDSMKALERQAPSVYAKYFPRYYSVRASQNEIPFICMERIDGISLESILRERCAPDRPQPGFLFTHDQLSHICSQVFHALYFLCANNIFYFDLLPCNIIVENQDYNIKLIDFTFCYQFPFEEGQYYKQMDNRLNCRFPLPLKMESALMLFFTRLFYCGEPCYNEYFHPHNPNNPGVVFFHQNFGELLHLLLDASDDELNSLIEDFSASSENTGEACCLRLEKWHDRLHCHIRRLENLCH